MNTNLRWKLAWRFVWLSSLVYLTLTLVSAAVFYLSLNHLLDSELSVLSAEASHAISVSSTDGLPHFREWPRIVQTEHGRMIATIELFSLSGQLLDSKGPPADGRMLADASEFPLNHRSMRVDTTPLTFHGRTVGYLQVELPTATRDDALQNFALTLAFIGPLVLLGLGWASYVVSGKATAPVEENMRTLRRFVADASHELNTPLAIIQAKVENIQRKLERAHQPHDDIDVIHNHLERMTKIVKDLTLLAEIESPAAAQAHTQENIDVASIVDRTVRSFEDRYHDKGVKLSALIEPAQTTGNSEMIYRLVTNLIENALRYTDAGGTVTVKLATDGNVIRLVVEDTGIGIAPEHLGKIFDRFYRVDRSRSRASGGSGIGLSIVKAIAEAHHGSVEAESTPERGSKFAVTVPVRLMPITRNLHDNQPSVQ